LPRRHASSGFHPKKTDAVYHAEIGRDVERRPWPRREGKGRTRTDELAEALELCVECLSEFSRLDDGTPSVSALLQARAALAKAGR